MGLVSVRNIIISGSSPSRPIPSPGWRGHARTENTKAKNSFQHGGDSASRSEFRDANPTRALELLGHLARKTDRGTVLAPQRKPVQTLLSRARALSTGCVHEKLHTQEYEGVAAASADGDKTARSTRLLTYRQPHRHQTIANTARTCCTEFQERSTRQPTGAIRTRRALHLTGPRGEHLPGAAQLADASERLDGERERSRSKHGQGGSPIWRQAPGGTTRTLE